MNVTMHSLARAAATVVGAAAFSLAAAGSALSQPADMLEIKLALAVADANFNPTTASVFRLAESMGFYEKHGVKVEFILLDGTPQAVAALNSGAVDIADIGLDAVIRLRADNDLPVRGLVTVAVGSPFLIAAKSDITTVAELAGRSFAIADNGSLDHTLTQAALRDQGITAETGPNFVAVGAPDVRVQALAAGRVDATTVSFGTYQSIVGTPGIEVLLPPDEFSKSAPAVSKFVAALEGTIETKREALQRFTDALLDTARAMEADPARWIAAITEAREDLSPESIAATSQFIASRWCVNGCMNLPDIEKSVAFVYENPDFKDVSVISYEDIIDPSFTAKSLQTLGVYAGIGLDSR